MVKWKNLIWIWCFEARGRNSYYSIKHSKTKWKLIIYIWWIHEYLLWNLFVLRSLFIMFCYLQDIDKQTVDNRVWLFDLSKCTYPVCINIFDELYFKALNCIIKKHKLNKIRAVLSIHFLGRLRKIAKETTSNVYLGFHSFI